MPMFRSFRAFTLVVTIAILAATGCNTPAAITQAHPRPTRQQKPSKPASPVERGVPSADTIGHSVEGRPIRCQVFGTGSRVTLILATIHGNEWAGTPLLAAMVTHLRSHPEVLAGRRVVLIPVTNPDGYAARRRHNVRGVDLNRNFPADNRKDTHRYGRQALSEPESLAIVAAMKRFRPDRVISIHQPAGCIDFDGPAKGLAGAMAEAGGLPVKRMGTRPGSLGAYIGEMMGTPIITLELPGGVARLGAEALWERFGRMMIVGVTYGET